MQWLWEECRTPFRVFKMATLVCYHFFIFPVFLSALVQPSGASAIDRHGQVLLTQQTIDFSSFSTQSFIKAVLDVIAYLHMLQNYQRSVKWGRWHLLLLFMDKLAATYQIYANYFLHRKNFSGFQKLPWIWDFPPSLTCPSSMFCSSCCWEKKSMAFTSTVKGSVREKNLAWTSLYI